LAGVFGSSACKRDVDFFLCKVFRLQERDALLERGTRDGWVLKDYKSIRMKHVSVTLIATYRRSATSQYGDVVMDMLNLQQRL
jgi:hypothetical protein